MKLRIGLFALLAASIAAPAFAQVTPKTPAAKPPVGSATTVKPADTVAPTVSAPKLTTQVTPNVAAPNTNVTPPTPVTPTTPTVPKQGVVRPNCAS